MTRRKRRNHSSAFKAKVALAALKGERTLAAHNSPTKCAEPVVFATPAGLVASGFPKRKDVFPASGFEALPTSPAKECLPPVVIPLES